MEFGKAAIGRLFNSSIPSKRTYSSEIIDLTDDDEEAQIEFKIIFPTLETVMNSHVGPEGFGTLFCKRKDFESRDTFSLLYNCTTNPIASPCKYAMHSKIMTVSSAKSKKPSYYYCGSHNFTASAWGKTTKNGSMLMISNYEVGVILPANIFLNDSFEYPYARPVVKYGQTDHPWDQNNFYSL